MCCNREIITASFPQNDFTIISYQSITIIPRVYGAIKISCYKNDRDYITRFFNDISNIFVISLFFIYTHTHTYTTLMVIMVRRFYKHIFLYDNNDKFKRVPCSIRRRLARDRQYCESYEIGTNWPAARLVEAS